MFRPAERAIVTRTPMCLRIGSSRGQERAEVGGTKNAEIAIVDYVVEAHAQPAKNDTTS